MTKKSRLANLRKENRKEAQENLKKANKIAKEHDAEIISDIDDDPKNLRRKGIITFTVEDIVVGRSIYDIMESID